MSKIPFRILLKIKIDNSIRILWKKQIFFISFRALKESGYESDSTLIFKRRDETSQQLSPQEQKEVYKSIQRGGEVPLHGLRKTVPERPKGKKNNHLFAYNSLNYYY